MCVAKDGILRGFNGCITGSKVFPVDKAKRKLKPAEKDPGNESWWKGQWRSPSPAVGTENRTLSYVKSWPPLVLVWVALKINTAFQGWLSVFGPWNGRITHQIVCNRWRIKDKKQNKHTNKTLCELTMISPGCSPATAPFENQGAISWALPLPHGLRRRSHSYIIFSNPHKKQAGKILLIPFYKWGNINKMGLKNGQNTLTLLRGIQMVQPLWKTFWWFLKMLSKVMWSIIPLLNIYPSE